MLKRETEKTYEQKLKGTVFVVESMCPPNCKADMFDALVALMKRDVETMCEEQIN